MMCEMRERCIIGVSVGLVPEFLRTLFSLHIGRVVGLVNIFVSRGVVDCGSAGVGGKNNRTV